MPGDKWDEAATVLTELEALHAEGWCACRSSSLPARIEAALRRLLVEREATTPTDDEVEAAAYAIVDAKYPSISWTLLSEAVRIGYRAQARAALAAARRTSTPQPDRDTPVEAVMAFIGANAVDWGDYVTIDKWRLRDVEAAARIEQSTEGDQP